MNSIEIITLITYICGVLGGILLLLCIILAAIFIYTICKKNVCVQGERYSLVQSENINFVENGPILREEDSLPLKDVQVAVRDEKHHDNIEENFKFIPKKGSNKISAPIKKKLLWKRKKKKSFSEDIFDPINFSDDDFNVPKPSLFKKRSQKVSFVQKPKSKSAWDLYDLPSSNPDSSYDDRECHRSLMNDYVDVGKSQYFDALDTITEEQLVLEDDDGNDKTQSEMEPILPGSDVDNIEDDREWIDMEPDDNLDEIPQESVMKQFLESQDAMASSVRNPKVSGRVKALKRLLLTSKYIEAKFYLDLQEVEDRYRKEHFQDLYQRRRKLIEVNHDDDPQVELSGIPGFWWQAMNQCDMLKEIVQIHDAPVLQHLQDIQVVSLLSNDNPGFRIEFHFSTNQYFSNKILTKTYVTRCHPVAADPLSFEGPEIIGCQGCKILWHKGMNVSVKVARKLHGNQIIRKLSKRNSFFNFFTPPKIPAKNKGSSLNMETSLLLEAHYQIGMFMKETFIPKAIIFFLGEDESQAKKRSKRKLRPSSKKVSLEENRDLLVLDSSSSLHSVAPNEQQRLNKKSSEVVNILDKAVNDCQLREEKDTEKKESESSQTDRSSLQPDPIIGRYRMASSENFDEFMKALNVGMIKRKMANSVTPVNVIEIDDDGTYTVRTETTLRTSEIKFKLNEVFTEETLDGRFTQTMPTRTGNLLTLEQKGDKKKKEKDSKMTRDFEGDEFVMKLIVDNVVCTRVYHRIKE